MSKNVRLHVDSLMQGSRLALTRKSQCPSINRRVKVAAINPNASGSCAFNVKARNVKLASFV